MAAITQRVRQALGGTATPEAAVLALAAVTKAITEGLLEEGEVKLSNFGTLRLCERAPRRLLLPGSQRPALLPNRKVLTFKPAPCTIRADKQAASSMVFPAGQEAPAPTSSHS